MILIGALFVGYSVIRAGTLAMGAAAVVSWLTPFRMGPRAILYALEIAAKMSLQLVAVCAAAGVIVGVIAMTGVGGRLSGVLMAVADQKRVYGAVLCHVHLDHPRHGHADDGRLRRGGIGCGTGPDPARNPAADGAFLHLLFRRDVGDHPARGARGLCRGGARRL